MFVTQGPIDPESNLFAGRGAELRRMEGWLPNTHCVGAVLGARQTGKTSLLLKLRHTLGAKYTFVFVDFEVVARATLAECLNYIAKELIAQLDGRISGVEPPVLRDQHDFVSFLEKCAQSANGVRIVLLLDEIGALLPDTAFKLSSAIRAVFTMRLVKPELARYVFVLAGATDMLAIAKGRSSPLSNVADSLYLGDLSAGETEQLVATVLGDTSTPAQREAFRTLHDWTAGHPYWTQLVGQALGQGTADVPDTAIEAVVEQLLRTEDRNLPHVFRALEADGGLWDLIGALLDQKPIHFSRANQAIAKLELIGLLKNDQGTCSIRNRIYREALEHHPIPRPQLAGPDLERLAPRLLKATNHDTLLQIVTLHLQAAFQNPFVITFMKQQGEGSFAIAASVGFTADGDLRFAGDSGLASPGDGPSEPRHLRLSQIEADLIETLGVSLILPIRLDDETVAFAWLGRKSAGEYDVRDRKHLVEVAELAANGFDKIRLDVMERELKEAGRRQRQLLPRKLPQLPGLRIQASLQPARVVAGDYYDALQLGPHTLALCIADVMGKGMPAAMLMASLQGCVRSSVTETLSPGTVCDQINRSLAASIDLGQFITFFYALVDNATRTLVCTNAGHNRPMLFRQDGTVVLLDRGGPPLGIFPEQRYEQQELVLAPGDRLLLFTDGVTESCNAKGEEFGDDRLIALGRMEADADALHRRVVEARKAFSPAAPQDDVTVVTLGIE